MEVIEWAEFSLKPDASEAAMLALAPAVTDWLRAQPGFRARRLSKGPDGRWADCCFWADMATAKAAADAIEAAPAVRPFLDLLDWKTVSVRHFAVSVTAE
jgi:HEAT repeat protein